MASASASASSNNANDDEGASYKTRLRQLPVLQSPYTSHDIGPLPSDPRSAFKLWLDDAIAAGIAEPHAMVLSTVDAAGYPDARVLILKHVDRRGWHFAIKADSPKGRQLAHSGKAALTFYWPALARQVRVRGDALPLPEHECRADFNERPLKARAGAIASRQSDVLPSRELLVQRVSDVEEAMQGGREQTVPQWVVFAVKPIEVEFWQGSQDRLHKRVKYSLSSDGESWQKDLIWP